MACLLRRLCIFRFWFKTSVGRWARAADVGTRGTCSLSSHQEPAQSLHPHIIDTYLHLFMHAYMHILYSLLSVCTHSYMHVCSDSCASMYSPTNSDKPFSVSYGPRIGNVVEGKKKSRRHLHPGISMLGGREARVSLWCVTRIQDGGCLERGARQGLEPQLALNKLTECFLQDAHSLAGSI